MSGNKEESYTKKFPPPPKITVSKREDKKPVEICGQTQYKQGMVIIGHFNKVVQSMDQWNGVINVLFLSISRQTLQLFNEYGG